jgi:hypothetical protein
VPEGDHWRFSASIFTRRTRSPACAAHLLLHILHLQAPPMPQVSEIAATIATSSSMAAISNG